MTAQFNLQTLLTANISNLTTQLNRANQQIGQFQRNNQATGGNIQSVFDGASKAVGMVAGAFIAVKGAAASFEKVIESNQSTSDAFAVTMAELNSTVDYFAASLGQMDFTNFFQNLRLSNEAAKQLAETLDLLGDINRADAITTAKEEVRLAELENTYVNKRLDKQTRLNALTEATKIKQDAVNRELGKQNTELEATLNTITKLPSYMNKFGNDTKPALELVSQYGDKWRSGVHDKASELNDLKKDANRKHVVTTTATSNFGAYSVSTLDKKADEEAKKKYNDYIAALGADVGTVVNWAGLLESVQQNDASLDKLTALLVKGESLNGELAKIQVENTRTTNKILGKGEDGEEAEINVKSVVKLKIDPLQFTDEIEKSTNEFQKLIDDQLENEKLDFVYAGLPKLEADLQELQRLQGLSSSPQMFKSYQVAIDATIAKIKAFKGETEDTAVSMGEFYSGMGSAFSSLADSAERFGNKSVAAFLNIVSATAQSIESITKLIEVFKTMSAVKQLADAADIAQSIDKAKAIDATVTATTNLTGVLTTMAATKQAANAAEIATAPAVIAANQGVAMSEGVAASAGVPFPGNLLAIAATIAAVIGAFASFAKFENGGIVGGSSWTGDNIMARVNSGEMILNKGQQANLFGMLNSGSGGASAGEVVFRIDGNTLVGVLNNHNKRMTNFK